MKKLQRLHKTIHLFINFRTLFALRSIIMNLSFNIQNNFSKQVLLSFLSNQKQNDNVIKIYFPKAIPSYHLQNCHAI